MKKLSALKKNKPLIYILWFGPSLFPKYLKKHYIVPYAPKALPCPIIRLKIIYESIFRNFDSGELKTATI